MGTLATDKNKIIFYYNSENALSQQAYGYVNASNRDILGIDISKTKVTGTQWAEIARKLELQISDLVDENHPDFVNEYHTDEMSLETEDWIKVLQNYPRCLKHPILIDGNSFYLIKTPSQVSKYINHEDHPAHGRSKKGKL